MTFTELPPLTRAAASLWAKSPRKNAGGDPGGLVPVLNHLLDVAACAAEILELEPAHTRAQLAADLGLGETEGLPWVLVLIALHDLGKASPAFQVLWEEGRRGVDARLPISGRLDQQERTPHGVVTQQVLPDILTEYLAWPAELSRHVADAVGCHHGFRAHLAEHEQSDVQLGPDTPDNCDFGWNEVRVHLVQLCAVAVGADFDVTPQPSGLSPAGFMRLAGLTSFADWLGSSFSAPKQTDYSAYHDPAAYFAAARVRARATLQQVHWPEFAPLHGTLPVMSEVFAYLSAPQTFTPRPLQEVMARELEGVAAPTLCIVEAPMGEGKTEAAFYAYLQLQQQLQHRGLYVALPTQATGNAMYTRLADFLGQQGRKRPPSLQLAHGGTLLSEEYQRRLEQTRQVHLDPAPNRPQDAEQSVRSEEWFGQRKRALLDEYGVGTVDQALLGVLGVSHQFVRLWGLGNRVVVLDEVHAYDTYTSAIIAALVGWLRSLGSSVILMSATLPQRSREALLTAWGSPNLPQADYPRVTVAQAGAPARAVTIPAGEHSRPPQLVQLRALGAGAGAVAAKAAELAAGGGCVAVIVNTVGRAQQVAQAVTQELRERGLVAQNCTETPPKHEQDRPRVGVLLYHARYPADERLYREERVLRYLGKGGQRPDRFILIATQVAEQSLDFDADVMISDLAPADLILQRAGRLHRHAANTERRRGHDTATLYVAGLDGWPQEALQTEFWGRIYAPALLYRSWAALRERLDGPGGPTLPDDLDRLVQRVYAGRFTSERLDDEQRQTLADAETELETRQGKEDWLGHSAYIGSPHNFWTTPIRSVRGVNEQEASDDDPEWLGTRLGSESVRIVPVFRDEAGVWWVCPLPRRLQDREKPPAPIKTSFSELEQKDVGHATRIYRRSLNVSRWEVVKLAAQVWSDGAAQLLGTAAGKRGWRAHPLLRDAVPIWFDGRSQARISDTLTLELHPELGLVYHRNEA